MSRQLFSSESDLEAEIGFSRAVRVGSVIAVSGTAPIAANGMPAAVGDAYGQTVRCLEIIQEVLEKAGARMDDVVRTRVMLTNIHHWRDAARAHGEFFGEIRPASTFVQVSSFIYPYWLVEVEADAVIA